MQNNPGSAHVLVVDDDPTVAEVVAGYLHRAGHDVARAADGPSALAHFARRRPDLVVLDLMLPGMDGFEVCRRMREQGGPVPVIMLTARGDEEDRVLGLETGADDYVTKPFSPRELVLRVESVLRRARLAVPPPGSSPAAARVLRTATLTLDPPARRATREGAELSLTLREFDLLAFFMRHPGRAFSREELMSEVWGWDFGDLSTVTVHVRRLRAKIEPDPARPSLIQTVWGVGYRMSGPEVPGGGPVEREAGGPADGQGPSATPSALTEPNGPATTSPPVPGDSPASRVPGSVARSPGDGPAPSATSGAGQAPAVGTIPNAPMGPGGTAGSAPAPGGGGPASAGSGPTAFGPAAGEGAVRAVPAPPTGGTTPPPPAPGGGPASASSGPASAEWAAGGAAGRALPDVPTGPTAPAAGASGRPAPQGSAKGHRQS